MNGFHFFLSYCFKYLFYFWKRNSCHQIRSLTKLVCITFFPFSFINIHIKGGTIRTKAATASTTLYSYLDIWYTNSWTSAIDALSCLAGMQYNRVILDYCRLHAWQQENSKTMWRISERERRQCIRTNQRGKWERQFMLLVVLFHFSFFHFL